MLSRQVPLVLIHTAAGLSQKVGSTFKNMINPLFSRLARARCFGPITVGRSAGTLSSAAERAEGSLPASQRGQDLAQFDPRSREKPWLDSLIQ